MKIFFSTLLFLLTTSIYAEVVKSINYDGMVHISEPVALRMLTFEKGDDISREMVDDAIKKSKSKECTDCHFIDENGEKEAYFNAFDEGILGSVVSFLYRNNKGAEAQQDLLDDLDMVVDRIELMVYGDGHKKRSYFWQSVQHVKGNLYNSQTSLHTLHQYVEKYYSLLSDKNQQLRDKYFLNSVIPCFKDDETIKILFRTLGLEEMWKWSSNARASSNTMVRELLYMIFSVMFGFVTEGNYSYTKKDGTTIRYCELRTLAHLRNKRFELRSFRNVLPTYFEDDNCVTIDYSILQVMDDFERYIIYPSRIDDLIRLHKYCTDTWKNGSKYLHFYTLHNQEHAITLIQQSISLIRIIAYFQLKKIDYYILFCACYLHDISMVTLPDYSDFYKKEHKEANLIYTEFINKIHDDNNNSSNKVKRFLLDSYCQIDRYFENKVRSTHASKSAAEIRTFCELDFL